ncbi:mushroom body large-type Kenyon cell-specific protein 1 isoform X1 [Nasonia vitripennis]|uniref:HTH psq-type domain-containing protein n=1 Tax=Nasonia vitripennis TaxID=7425 RepID=A0A7M7ITU0_NASVI|nr:mushroom body large-type Kenyon cell-specific protein 1 isoform X1 [Nasonia vitripennis]
MPKAQVSRSQGLERVAEELMGRRRWKQYQDTLYSGTRSTDNASTATSQHHQQQLQLQLQQLAQQVQQAKPGDTAQQSIKSGLANHQQRSGSTTTNCTSAVVAGGGVSEHSPRRADETGAIITGGPENGRLAEGARENGATGASSEQNGNSEQLEDVVIATGEDLSLTAKDVTETTRVDEEDEEATAAQRIKRERLDERIRLSPLREDDGRQEPRPDHKTNDTEGTKEVKEETAERPQVTQGLLRVKKEEELQETPGPGGGGGGLLCPNRPTSTPLNNNGSSTAAELQRSASTPPKKEVIFCTPTYLLGRRASPPPEDWKPLDKCYFCLDGKLPHDEQPPLDCASDQVRSCARQSPQSDSSNSSRSAESPMSVQVDPMAASVVAAALSGTYPTLLPQWCLPPREPPHIIAAAAAAAAAAHQQENQGADQPLDLSAKPKNSQDNNISILEQQKIPLRMSAAIDPKAIFNSSCYRAKPRVTGAVSGAALTTTGGGGGGGRRTYTEDELQAALRDIQSGKLGTRRAAVLYGIPRSTLRNKVYKLAMERERDASLSAAANSTTSISTTTTSSTTTANQHQQHNNEVTVTTVTGANAASSTPTTSIASTSTSTTTTTITTPNTTRQNAASATTPLPQVDEADEKELSGAEEEKEVEKALLKPLLSLEDLVRFSSLEGSGGESLRQLLQRGQDTGAAEWSAFEHANIGPYIQKMLAAASPFNKVFIDAAGLESQDYRIPEVMRRLMCEDKKLSKEANVNGDQVQHIHQVSLQHRLPQSGQRAPMTNDDFNPAIEEEASDSGQGRPILKIPSYKPASSTTPGPSKNGAEPNAAATAFAQSFAAAAAAAANAVAGSPGLLERASPAFSGTSSPTNSLVGKGMAVNFRDVIAKSISVKFQEGQQPTGMPGQGGQSSQSMIAEPNPYKRGRYTPPQQSQQGGGQHSAHQQSQQSKNAAQQQAQQDKNQNKSGAGGKGTRPKRGKYRNYDRDSLVEAVRAVQRGEMSVHRAGSYYGVPHSTLEYKVKERHLMRPRKRDQKQPDDKAKEPTATGAAIRTTPAATPEKKPLLKPQKPFTPAAGAGGMPGPNGLKMPPFMEGMPPMAFGHPFNFWGPTPFMPSPFIPGGPNVPGILPEQYFASQRMRGLQEQQRNAIVQQQQRDSATAEQPGTSNSRGTSLIKSPREMAESLYDGTAANGSFLDNLIRSSLEPGAARSNASSQQATQQQPENMGGSKVLIDQLCRNSRRTPLPRAMQQDSSEDEAPVGYKAARPLPERPERVPTVDLSPSPSERARATDEGSDRGLASPPTPLSLSRLSGSGREDETTRDSRSSREREVQNGGGSDKSEERQDSSTKKLNHYPEIHNLYAVSTDKKSACDSKLIVDHSSQKTQQHKDNFAAAAGAAVGLASQLQRSGYNNMNSSGTAAAGNGHTRPTTPCNNQSSSERADSPQEQVSSPQPPSPAQAQLVLMEETVEQ